MSPSRPFLAIISITYIVAVVLFSAVRSMPQIQPNEPTASGYNPNFKMSRDECFSKYGKKRFREKNNNMPPPPLLLSFPGSGNTWARLLIEIATEVFTGSIYTDRPLKAILGGEKHCSVRTSVIKAHPLDMNISVPGRYSHTLDSAKCHRGGVDYFDRVVFLNRDPFRAIWSDFQRVHLRNHFTGYHRDKFRWFQWGNHSVRYARHYKIMWEETYQHAFRTFNDSDVIMIEYEKLTSADSSNGTATSHGTSESAQFTKEIELERLVRFLDFPVDKERIQCAFVLAENPKVKRKINVTTDMTIDTAYERSHITCNVWQTISNITALHYSPPKYPFSERFSC